MPYVNFLKHITLVFAIASLVACGGGGGAEDVTGDSNGENSGGGDVSQDGSLSQNELALLSSYRGVWTSDLCENQVREAIYVTDGRVGYGRFEYDDFNCTDLLKPKIGAIADKLSSWATGISGEVYTLEGVESFITEGGLNAVRIDVSGSSDQRDVIQEFRLFKDTGTDSLYVSIRSSLFGLRNFDFNFGFSKVENDYSNFIDTISGTYTSACLAGNSQSGKLGEDGDGFYYKKFVTIDGTPGRLVNSMYSEQIVKYMDSNCAGARETLGLNSCNVLFARKPKMVDGVEAYPIDCMRGNTNPIYDLYYLNNDGSISRGNPGNINYPSAFDDYFRLYPEQ